MKIIAIDTESTVGMLCPISNQSIMWEFDDADEFEASILASVLEGVIAADFPDDVTFCKELIVKSVFPFVYFNKWTLKSILSHYFFILIPL